MTDHEKALANLRAAFPDPWGVRLTDEHRRGGTGWHAVATQGALPCVQVIAHGDTPAAAVAACTAAWLGAQGEFYMRAGSRSGKTEAINATLFPGSVKLAAAQAEAAELRVALNKCRARTLEDSQDVSGLKFQNEYVYRISDAALSHAPGSDAALREALFAAWADGARAGAFSNPHNPYLSAIVQVKAYVARVLGPEGGAK